MKTLCKRTFSTLLAMVMVLTTFCTAGMQWNAGAVSSAVTAAEPQIVFHVPELIYLDPTTMNTNSTSMSSIAHMDHFQYYVDYAAGNTTILRTGENTTGNFYFYCSEASGTNAEITCSGATNLTWSKTTTSATTLQWSLTGGTDAAWTDHDTVKTITWTVTY